MTSSMRRSSARRTSTLQRCTRSEPTSRCPPLAIAALRLQFGLIPCRLFMWSHCSSLRASRPPRCSSLTLRSTSANWSGKCGHCSAIVRTSREAIQSIWSTYHPNQCIIKHRIVEIVCVSLPHAGSCTHRPTRARELPVHVRRSAFRWRRWWRSVTLTYVAMVSRIPNLALLVSMRLTFSERRRNVGKGRLWNCCG